MSVFLKAIVLTALIILFMYNVITLNLLIFGIYMFRRNLLILWVIGTVAGCSNVSESDARYLDTYSLCYEVGNSAPAYRSAALEVVSKELARRGLDMSDEECKKGTIDSRQARAIRKAQQRDEDAQLEAACIASGGTWYISFCKKEPVKIDVNVY
ncbi:Lipoprotein [Vibrio crassostreae]|nr:Lipoprotein [Vibrio crassostreae]